MREHFCRNISLHKIEGPLTPAAEMAAIFLKAPIDICPEFQGPPGSKLKKGRGKDHPRYGRFVYAFAKWLKPAVIVEVGTYAGAHPWDGRKP